MPRKCLNVLLFLTVFSLLLLSPAAAVAAEKPNIILVFIDDMGWGDFSCFGNTEAQTPNIDKMAEEGLAFKQFYVNSPICSPSRTAISTGCYPQRFRITSYLSNRKHNNERGMAQWLDPKTPMLARCLQQAGYATGHFGKWHMGGQRDVAEAPAITRYGFDESLTNFEGMGAKLLPLTEVPTQDGGIKKGRIWADAERLGEPVTWMLRSKITGGFVDRAIQFIDKAKKDNKPFYINVWPDDVHSPFFPSVQRWTNDKRKKYLAVLEEMDEQFGKLFSKIKEDKELYNNTIILICSDNGPEPGAGSAAHLRGTKGMLYEGGVRSPLIVWSPKMLEKSSVGTVNEKSIFAAIDLTPSLLKLANVPIPDGVKFDGEAMTDTILGKEQASRKSLLFFRRPPDRNDEAGVKNLPDLSVRDGKWKLLCDHGGKNVQLYNLDFDPSEKNNIAGTKPLIENRLTEALLKWNETLPKDAGCPGYKK